MAAPTASSITHFLHPKHALFPWDSRYTCDGCQLPGSGLHYRCNACDFDLHHHCATCLSVVSCSLHPQHQLSLRDHGRSPRHFCDLCNFDLHPGCTQLTPAAATTPVPPTHSTREGRKVMLSLVKFGINLAGQLLGVDDDLVDLFEEL